MLTKEQIIENIQALIRLADGNPSQGEAEAAMAKAAKLMAEHNVAMAELNATQDDDWTEVLAAEMTNKSWESDSVANILQKFFFVRVIAYRKHQGFVHSRQKSTLELKMFGSKQNVDVAKYVYAFLCRSFRDLWANARTQKGYKKTDAKAYYYGLAQGFTAKMEETRRILSQNSANALVVVDAQLNAAYQEYARLNRIRTTRTTVYVRNPQALQDGRTDGRNINLRDALNGSNTKRIAS